MAVYDKNYWQRLENVINWSRMSTNRFAKHIGLPRAETLYQIERGNNGLSRKLAENIVTHFPEVNLNWLLTGSGEMLLTSQNEGAKTNYYDVDVERNIRIIDSLTPDTKITLPNHIDLDFAIAYRGDAMADITPTNSMLMLKRHDVNNIVYGKEYIVVTPKLSILRIIRRNDERGTIRLIAGDNESYDDIIIESKEIEMLYIVTAKLLISY